MFFLYLLGAGLFSLFLSQIVCCYHIVLAFVVDFVFCKFTEFDLPNRLNGLFWQRKTFNGQLSLGYWAGQLVEYPQYLSSTRFLVSYLKWDASEPPSESLKCWGSWISTLISIFPTELAIKRRGLSQFGPVLARGRGSVVVVELLLLPYECSPSQSLLSQILGLSQWSLVYA